MVNYVDRAYQDNFTEFCTWYPDVERNLESHDSAVTELGTACSLTFQRVLESPEFIGILEQANAAALERGVTAQAARGAIPIDQWPSLIAEYVINGIRTLPEHYTSAAYWKAAGPIVLRCHFPKPLPQGFLKTFPPPLRAGSGSLLTPS